MGSPVDRQGKWDARNLSTFSAGPVSMRVSEGETRNLTTIGGQLWTNFGLMEEEHQTDKLDANRACIARQKNLPTDVHTCFEEESLEDAQTRMMSVVLRELVAAESR